MKKLGILEVKQALFDQRFRDLFPEYKEDLDKFMQNPGCGCNMPFLHKLMNHKDRLQKYFPTKDIETTNEMVDRIATNHWKVINCKRSELESELRKLPKGRKQLTVAIWQEEATVVINELDIVW